AVAALNRSLAQAKQCREGDSVAIDHGGVTPNLPKTKLVTLRSIEREDLIALAAFQNDLKYEVLGRRNAPTPQPLAALQVQFDENLREGRRIQFVIEADGKVIGECGLRDF